MQFDEVAKGFFQLFVQFYDTEMKLKKICKANPKKMIKLIEELTLNSDLNVKLMAEFLYFDV